MKQNALIAGVGMTRFGKHLDRSLSSLAHEAIDAALKDAGLEPGDIQAAWAGVAGAPIMTGQTLVAGQMILRGLGIGRIPVVNVENACATASTAFQQACTMVSLGVYDAVLSFGVEKLFHPEKERAFAVLGGAVDTERPEELLAYVAEGQPDDNPARARSFFMDIYARMARDYSERSGATDAHYARISAKNSLHGSLNPLAQFQDRLTEAEVLAAPVISAPLTLPMCSPIGDGAAAAVIVSPRFARERGIDAPIRVMSSLLASSYDPGPGEPGITTWAAAQAYDQAGVGPEDIDCVELHDATTPAELICCEALGLCRPGEGPALLDSGATTLGGRVPVNVSGGLVRKGHPIGATGLAQIYELTLQLRGRAGGRQVDGARIGVAENGGGFLGRDAAVVAMTVLSQ
ncbi:MAG: thiolase [Sphingopyxis sp.]|nr:thiolase [Sphingopyxis sp.]